MRWTWDVGLTIACFWARHALVAAASRDAWCLVGDDEEPSCLVIVLAVDVVAHRHSGLEIGWAGCLLVAQDDQFRQEVDGVLEGLECVEGAAAGTACACGDWLEWHENLCCTRQQSTTYTRWRDDAHISTWSCDDSMSIWTRRSAVSAAKSHSWVACSRSYCCLWALRFWSRMAWM